jgi:hypothetical protein
MMATASAMQAGRTPPRIMWGERLEVHEAGARMCMRYGFDVPSETR